MSDYPLAIPALAPPSFGQAAALQGAVHELDRRSSQRSGYMTRDRLGSVAGKLRQVHDGSVPSSEFTQRDVRLLAWALNHGDPPLSGTPAFRTALAFFQGPCRPKMLMGLVSTFLDAREIESAHYLAWSTLIAHHLARYQGGDEDLAHWKQVAPLLFAPDAAAKVGKWCLVYEGNLGSAIRALCPPSWRGRPRMSSPVFTSALRSIIQAVALSGHFPARLKEALDLVEAQAQSTELLKVAVNLFLEQFARKPQLGLHEELLDLALRHFGDPRLVHNQHWLGFSDEARETCKRWVSRADLELFFKSVAMDDDRRRFWLRYVDQMTYSLIVLGPGVQRASDPSLQQFLKQRRHATLEDGDYTASAAIFQIRDVLIVEFSYSGDACYLYRMGEEPFDLGSSTFVKSRTYRNPRNQKRHVLKDKRQEPEPIRDNRIIHNGDWYARARQKLLYYGISLGPRR